MRSNHILLRSPDGDVNWLQKTNFFTRAKQFVIKLPEWWVNVLDYDHVSADTLDGVDSAFHHAMVEYEERITKRRKVIVYTFQATAKIFEYDENGKVKRCLFRQEEIHFVKGTALDFWWTVGYETMSEIDKHKKYTYLNGNSIGRNTDNFQYKTMGWTKQREEFFRQLQNQLNKIIVQAHMFFSLETSEIAKLVDSSKRFAALPDLSGK